MFAMFFCWIKKTAGFFLQKLQTSPGGSLLATRLPQRGSNGYMATPGEVESPNKAQRKLSRGQGQRGVTPKDVVKKLMGNPMGRTVPVYLPTWIIDFYLEVQDT